MFFANTEQALEYGRKANEFEIAHLRALKKIYEEKLKKQCAKSLMTEADWNAAMETAVEIQLINEALSETIKNDKTI